MWVVRRYRGEPQGLDGQRLRWCRRDELAAAELLPADRPILAALRLPERLRRHRTRYYRVGGMSVLRARRLPGESVPRRGCSASCAATPGRQPARRLQGADFLVLRKVLSDGELAAFVRARAAVPLFARGISLARAWTLGASGINVIAG